MQIWFIGRTPASQAGEAGSTPVICFFICKKSVIFPLFGKSVIIYGNGEKGLNPHESVHKWMQDPGTPVYIHLGRNRCEKQHEKEMYGFDSGTGYDVSAWRMWYR